MLEMPLSTNCLSKDARLALHEINRRAIRQINPRRGLHSRHLVNGHGMTGPQLAVLQEAFAIRAPSRLRWPKRSISAQATLTVFCSDWSAGHLVQRPAQFRTTTIRS